MPFTSRSIAVAVLAGATALLTATGCSSSTHHSAAAVTSPSTTQPAPTTTRPTSTPTVAPTATTHPAGATTTHSTHPATTAHKTTASSAPSTSCGSQLSPGGHETAVFNAISGRVENNPKCLGLDMHDTLYDVSYDLHGNNPTTAVLQSQGSATSTVKEQVTVAFSNYGMVGSTGTMRTVTVTVTGSGKKLVWHLVYDPSGLHWSAA